MLGQPGIFMQFIYTEHKNSWSDRFCNQLAQYVTDKISYSRMVIQSSVQVPAKLSKISIIHSFIRHQATTTRFSNGEYYNMLQYWGKNPLNMMEEATLWRLASRFMLQCFILRRRYSYQFNSSNSGSKGGLDFNLWYISSLCSSRTCNKRSTKGSSIYARRK